MMGVEEIRQEKLQAEMVIEDIIKDLQEKTGLWVESITTTEQDFGRDIVNSVYIKLALR